MKTKHPNSLSLKYLIIILLVSMAGCTSRRSVTKTKTFTPEISLTVTETHVTAGLNPEIQTISPTSTRTRLPPTYTPKKKSVTPSPTQTPTRTKTPTPSLTPTFTSTPTLMAFPDAPTPAASIIYTLQTPDSQQLLYLINLNRNVYKVNQFSGDYEDLTYQARMAENNTFDYFIANDLRRYYPIGIPSASTNVTGINLNWEGLFFSPSDSVIELLLTGAVQYFNDQHIQFTSEHGLYVPAFTMMAYAIDLNGDGKNEWLVQLNFQKYEFMAWLPLKMDQNGTYVLIPTDLPTHFTTGTNTTINIDISHDLTGDSRKDIVISYTYYSAGSIHGYLEIYAWKQAGIYLLDTVNLPGVNPRFAETYETQYNIKDHNGDGHDEIQVTWPRFRPFGCAWQTVYLDRWVGKKRLETVKDLETPDQPECYIAEALESNNPVDQVRWLESALRMAESKGVSQDLLAWIKLRLAIVYSGQGRNEDADQELKAIAEEKGQGAFLKAVQDAYRNTDSSFTAVCKSLYATAEAMNDTDSYFKSTIDDDLAIYNYYPIGLGPEPDLVCPYWDLVKNRLSITPVYGSAGPVSALEAMDYQFTQPITLAIDRDPEAEWLGVLDVGRPLVVALDPIKGGWKIAPIEYLGWQASHLEASVYTSGNNGTHEILIIVTLIDQPGVENTFPCNPGQKDYQLILADITQAGFISKGSRTYSCQNEPPVEISTEKGKEKFIEIVNSCPNCDLINDYHTQPAWYYLEGLAHGPNTDQNVFDYISNLEDRLFSGTGFGKLRLDIENVIDFLPKDDPATKILINELHYMVGLCYEFEGEPKQAVSAYLSLIQEAPGTPWSWLAWSRLKPNPIEK